MGVVALAGGVASGRSDRVVLGAVLVVVGGLFAAFFLATQFRAGTLTETALRVPVGVSGHVSVPLSEIVEVGMVYTIPAGWLSYIWRDDGTAVHLPLMKLKTFLPDRRSGIADWHAIAATRQGGTCIRILAQVEAVNVRQPQAISSEARQAGRKRETSFWSANPASGVVPIQASRTR